MSKKQEYKLKNEEYLKELSQREGIQSLSHGVLYEVIRMEAVRDKSLSVRSSPVTTAVASSLVRCLTIVGKEVSLRHSVSTN